MKRIELQGRTVLVTGAAGFIGANLSARLLCEAPGVTVVGIDNMNDYYDVGLKEERLRAIEKLQAAAGERGTNAASRAVCGGQVNPPAGEMHKVGENTTFPAGSTAPCAEGSRFVFIRASIADRQTVEEIFAQYHPDIVVNLAAQAGVRWSISHPDDYIESNLIGFYNILEACRHSYDGGERGVEHLVFASSSSVYGAEAKVPFDAQDKADRPVSLYAATKRSDELLAHAYSKLYEIPSTGLRFFTVYGPAGRPDMAYFSFAEKLRAGETIRIFNYGDCRRDFTYIDDVIEGVVRVMKGAPERAVGEDGLPSAPYALYNIGNSAPQQLMDFVEILKDELVLAGVLPEAYDLSAHMELVPMQPGDVPVTFADTGPLERDYGFRPATPLREGLRRFAQWYAAYCKG